MTITKAKRLEEKLNSSKRQYTILKYPLDVDITSTQNIMMIEINAISGSRYVGQKYKIVEGESARVEQPGSGSLNRHMAGNTVRVDTAIALHMPPNIQYSYSSEWEASNLGTIGALYDAFKGFGSFSSYEDWKRNIKQIGSAAGAVAANTATKMLDVITPGKIHDTYQLAYQQAENPYTEVLFRGIGNRTFSFTFKFIPKSRKEQEEIKKIVDTLKFHRAPEKKASTGNLYWNFPSTFDITFLKKDGQENEWLSKISTCALTNLNIQQGSDNHYASFSDGSPYSTTITMEFLELEVMDKERISQGF